MRKELDDQLVSFQAEELSAVKELASTKLAKKALEDKHRALLAKHEAAKAELKACREAQAKEAAPPPAREPRAEQPTADGRGDASGGRGWWEWS